MKPGFPVGGAIERADLAGDPHPVLARLREAEPVSWVPALGGWLVTDRASVLAALRDAETFTVDDPRFSTGRVLGPSMLSLDGPEHQRHRSPFVAKFRARAVADDYQANVGNQARELVGGIAGQGRAELRTALAGPLAAALRTHLMARADDGAGRTALVDEIRAGGTLDDRELFSNTAVVLFGAVETCEAMTSNALHHLLSTAPQGLIFRKPDRLVADWPLPC